MVGGRGLSRSGTEIPSGERWGGGKLGQVVEFERIRLRCKRRTINKKKSHMRNDNHRNKFACLLYCVRV